MNIIKKIFSLFPFLNKKEDVNSTKWNILILAFFTVLTIAFTYPQARCIKQCVYSTGDQLYYAWMLDRNLDSFLHKPLNQFFNGSIFYPYKNTIAYGDHLIGETIIASPMLLVYDNPIFAQNVLILLSFIFTAFGTYLLAFLYTKNRIASIFAGIIFTFSNVRFNQYDHLNLISTQWLPFLFLFLHRWLEDKKKIHLAAFGLVYFFASLFTFYYYVFSSFAIVLYVVCYKLFFLKKPIQTMRSLIPLLFTIIVVNILLIPTLIPYFQFKNEFPDVQRTLYDNVQFSATPLSFIYNAKTTITARISGNDQMSESNSGLSLGYIPLILAAIAIFKRNKFSKDIRLVIFFAATSFSLYFLLSFGPFLKFTQFQDTGSVPLPYFVLYYIFPPFKILRVPARFIILADLFLSILAAIGFSVLFYNITNRFTNSKLSLKKGAVLVGLGFLIILESWSIPMDLVYVELKQDFPPVYYWLKDKPEDIVILELPIPKVSDPLLLKMTKTRHAFLKNLTQEDYDTIEAYRNYFSILHRKRLVNGYNAFSPPIYNETVTAIESFPSEKSIEYIKNLDINYIIVHRIQFPEDDQEKIMTLLLNNKKLQLIQRFGDDFVFEVI